MYIGKIDEALLDISKAIEIDPEYVDALVLRADIYIAIGLKNAALKDYERLLELDPENDDLREMVESLKDELNEEREYEYWGDRGCK